MSRTRDGRMSKPRDATGDRPIGDAERVRFERLGWTDDRRRAACRVPASPAAFVDELDELASAQ